MNPEVQNVAPAPVLNYGPIPQFIRIIGRGERIRTSGPCLPKAVPLAAHGSFPWFPFGGQAHNSLSVHGRHTPKVQRRTLEHCLCEREAA